jgi:uncharacterized protein YbjT (DUF2867 family)
MTQSILVFGATGQQGGSVAAALIKAGWPVRALVRDRTSEKAATLAQAGVELTEGSFEDIDAMRRAMGGAYGVFSVQPSSPGGAVSDAEEVRYGITVADLAVESGVKHLVYSSGAAVRTGQSTGLGHFDSKAAIERHIHTLPITATIVRPAAFMDMLLMPGFGLDEGRFTFFNRPDQPMQFIAVEDIGKIVAAVFADLKRFGGETFEIASDALTGTELGEALSDGAGRPIAYQRYSDDVLASNPFLAKLTALLDDGTLAGQADLKAMRAINPELKSFRSWLAGDARNALDRALGTSGSWAYNQ